MNNLSIYMKTILVVNYQFHNKSYSAYTDFRFKLIYIRLL